MEKAAEDVEKLLNRISDGFLSLDQNLVYTYVNQKICEITGKTSSELVNRHIWDVFPDAVGTATYHAIQKALKEQVYVCNTDYYKHLDLWQENHIYPKEQGLDILIKDVSEKKRAEVRLSSSENMYRSLFKNLLHGFAYCEIIFENGKAVDYVHLMVNHAYESLTGLADLTGKTATEAVPGLFESDPDYLELVTRVAISGQPETIETYVSQLDKWLSVSLYSPGKGSFVALVDDISEKINFNEQQSLMMSIVNYSDDAIISKNLSGIITSWNPGAEKLFGYQPHEAIGMPVTRLIPADRQYQETEIIQEITQGRSIHQYETQRVTKNGDLICVSITISPIRDSTGKITGASKIARNITEILAKAMENEKLVQQLSHNNKDLQQFAYITAHNLRGPIANLLGLTNLLDSMKIKNKEMQQIVGGIRKASLTFDETVRDLSSILTIKDNPSVHRETLELLYGLGKAKSHCSRLIEESRANIRFDFSEAPTIYFNRSYLESIFMNLLTNAIKYRDWQRPLEIGVRSRVEKEYTVLEFSDNGIGFDVDTHREKIFKLYQRFHEDREGKGLGLFLIRSQLETLGGNIHVDSKMNEGTLFTIQFKN
jgi:PAS domain S-box-containing protein